MCARSRRAALCVCVRCSGEWRLLLSSYAYPWSVSDLTPSIGLHWYLFTQTFDRFRLFFQLVLALLPATLAAALCATPQLGQQQPHVAAVLVCALLQLTHPQPVLGGLNLSACLLLAAGWLVGPSMRAVYVQVCVLLFSVAMMQLMWFLWLGPGSGNANFFYFQTLLAGFAFAALIVEVTAAARKQLASPVNAGSAGTRD